MTGFKINIHRVQVQSQLQLLIAKKGLYIDNQSPEDESTANSKNIHLDSEQYKMYKFNYSIQNAVQSPI